MLIPVAYQPIESITAILHQPKNLQLATVAPPLIADKWGTIANMC